MRRAWRRARRQERNQRELERAGINGQAGKQRRIPGKARVGHHHAIGHADKHIAAKNRQGKGKGLPRQGFFHEARAPSFSQGALPRKLVVLYVVLPVPVNRRFSTFFRK